jgi:hypothetical protein
LLPLALVAQELTPPRIPALRAEPRIEKLLRNEVRYLLATLPSGEIPNEQENSLRPLTATALSAAVCLKFAGCEAPEPTHAAVIRILRDVTRTHRTGDAATATGRRWGDQWQSALWAWQAAFAGWLLWDDLPAELRQAVLAMTVHEADRFADLPPPYAEFLDTKAEENAWNSLILVLASEALPGHPHRARWRARALEYMISAFATRADRSSDRMLDGRRLRDWVTGTNIHSDYTLENHGFVHPDYMSTVSLNLMNAAVYRLLGRPVPDAVLHNAQPVYDNLKFLTLPDGSLLYPSGTDWNLHRVDMTWNLHVQMERLAKDPQAGALAEVSLETLERMQARSTEGRTFAPQEFPSYQGHEPQAGWALATGLLCAKLWPPAANPKALARVWKELEGARIFEDGRFFVLRSAKAVSAFSWGLRIMGLTVPFTLDPIVNPINRSYVGLATELDGDRDKPGRTGVGSLALERAIARDSLTISTVISGLESGAAHVTANARHGGHSQVFSFTALPSGQSVYIERWRGREGPVHRGLISLLSEPDWVFGRAARTIERSPDNGWVNVDDRLGFAMSGNRRVGIQRDFRNVLLELNEGAGPETTWALVTLPGATLAETRQFAAQRFPAHPRHPDVAAVLVDGLLVATNLSPHPLSAEIECGTAVRTVAINGFSTRVLRVE